MGIRQVLRRDVYHPDLRAQKRGDMRFVHAMTRRTDLESLLTP